MSFENMFLLGCAFILAGVLLNILLNILFCHTPKKGSIETFKNWRWWTR